MGIFSTLLSYFGKRGRSSNPPTETLYSDVSPVLKTGYSRVSRIYQSLQNNLNRDIRQNMEQEQEQEKFLAEYYRQCEGDIRSTMNTPVPEDESESESQVTEAEENVSCSLSSCFLTVLRFCGTRLKNAILSRDLGSELETEEKKEKTKEERQPLLLKRNSQDSQSSYGSTGGKDNQSRQNSPTIDTESGEFVVIDLDGYNEVANSRI